MVRKIRRTSFGLRFEMMPLLDVIFLLLTFFLYSQAVMIHAEVLPVKLPGLLSSGGGEVEGRHIVGITIDGEGRIYVNRELTTLDVLGKQLDEAMKKGEVSVFLALEDRDGDVDRAPMVLRVFDIARQAGVGRVNVVSKRVGNGEGSE